MSSPEISVGLADPLDSLLGYQLRRASTVMMADLASNLAEIALRPTEASILLLIDANPACTQSDIGRSLGIQRANMVPLMANLMKRGLVDRSPVDGRSQALSISETGAALVVEARVRMERHESRFQQLFDPDSGERLIEALKQIRAVGD